MGTLRTTPTVDVSQGWHGDEWAGGLDEGSSMRQGRIEACGEQSGPGY